MKVTENVCDTNLAAIKGVFNVTADDANTNFATALSDINDNIEAFKKVVIDANEKSELSFLSVNDVANGFWDTIKKVNDVYSFFRNITGATNILLGIQAIKAKAVSVAMGIKAAVTAKAAIATAALKSALTFGVAAAAIAVGIGLIGVSMKKIGLFAQGGFPDRGSLFIANESGSELVGSWGNCNAVFNNTQILQGITAGVHNANLEQNQLLREQNQISLEQNALLKKILNAVLVKNSSITLDGVEVSRVLYPHMKREEAMVCPKLNIATVRG